MTTSESSKLLALLESQKIALRRSDFRRADALSRKIDAFIHENRQNGLPKEQQDQIVKSFAQLELIMESQKHAVSQQLQNLRSRRAMFKTYRDQVKT